MKKKITVIIKKLRHREDEETLLGPAMRLLKYFCPCRSLMVAVLSFVLFHNLAAVSTLCCLSEFTLKEPQ